MKRILLAASLFATPIQAQEGWSFENEITPYLRDFSMSLAEICIEREFSRNECIEFGEDIGEEIWGFTEYTCRGAENILKCRHDSTIPAIEQKRRELEESPPTSKL